jgi:hypothetical protein
MSKDKEFTSPMKESAIQMHELYLTLKQAGFSRKDAIELLARVIAATMNDTLNSSPSSDSDNDSD